MIWYGIVRHKTQTSQEYPQVLPIISNQSEITIKNVNKGIVKTTSREN